MTTILADHALVAHHMTALRNKETPPAEFRRLVQRLTVLLTYEAMRSLPLQPVDFETPVAPTRGRRLSQTVGLVPILRAGLGMVDPVLSLLPDAEVWHLGMYRDEETAKPVEYYSKLLENRAVDVGIVLDPMLATGGSATLAVEALTQWGVTHIKMLSLIASRQGLERLTTQCPSAEVFVCEVDDSLNERKFIVPGLGDAGDRIFNT